jgi:aspartate aminotransferase-like enzyme
VPEATLLELAKPVHHHRTGEFRAMFNEVQQMLQYVYQTSKNVYTITGSGTAAFEAGLVSTLAPGAKALCVVNGKFAERWSQMCTTYGIEHKDLKLEYGQHASPEMIGSELKGAKYDAVIIVHSETSTGTVCDLANIAKVVRGHGDTLLMVDGITSIGALPFKMDEWGVDVAITGSQKALMLRPGSASSRSPIAPGPRSSRTSRRRISISTCGNTRRASPTATRRSRPPTRWSRRCASACG